MLESLTPKQVARAIGVSDASLKRWCDKGVLPSVRTAGGHRRIPLNAVVQFLRRSGHPVVRPEILGLPATTGLGHTVTARSVLQMREALASCDEQRVHRIALDLYLAGQRVYDICDRTFAPAFELIGEMWSHGDLEVYQERRGCEIAVRLLHKLLMMLPDVPPNAPVAVGGTFEHDHYVLPTTMIEVVLRECGWRAESFGVGLPVQTLLAALERSHPRLLWISASQISDERKFLDDYARLYAAAAARGVAVAVGGRALSESVREQMEFTASCVNLTQLTAFVKPLGPRSSASDGDEPASPAEPGSPA